MLGHDSSTPLAIHLDDGTIAAVEPLSPSAPVDYDVVAPGLIDWQVNGSDDLDVWTIARNGDHDAWTRLADRQLRTGVTTWLPTLVSAALPLYASALGHLAPWLSDSLGRVPGVHLEGPFLGSAPGAHRREAIVPVDLDWIASLPSMVRVMTLAAENPGATDAVTELMKKTGMRVSIGHSRPSRSEFEAALARGASSVTHLFNGMSGLGHRDPGLAAWALLDDRVWCGLIADGVHVAPEMIALAFRLAGDRITLVSDSVAWRASGLGATIIDGAPRLPDGTLAGSAITMGQAIEVCVTAGVPWFEALRAASSNVADFLGLDDRGHVQRGRRADLVAFDDNRELTAVWTAGERVR